MSSTCVSPIRGLAMRATRVNNCGCPIEGADGFATSCGFVTIGLTAQIEEGTEIVVRTAAGVLCVNEPACRTLKRYDVTIDFCQVDPELFELIAGHRLLLDYKGDAVGHTVDETLNCETGFALEVWSSVAGQDVCAGVTTGQWYYWLIPFVANGLIGGDITIEDGPVTFQFQGQTKKNGCWGRGPYDVVAIDSDITPGPLQAPGVMPTEHLYARTVEIEPPECLCGTQTLTIPDVVIPETATQTENSARDELEALDLAVNETNQEECSDTVAAGSVIETTPAAGETVNSGSVVTLTISTGPCAGS